MLEPNNKFPSSSGGREGGGISGKSVREHMAGKQVKTLHPHTSLHLPQAADLLEDVVQCLLGVHLQQREGRKGGEEVVVIVAVS